MSLHITEEAYAYRKQDKGMLYHPILMKQINNISII